MSNTEWKKVKLGDIAKVNNGKGIKKSEYLVDGAYPIIGANGEIGRCNDYNIDHPVLTTGRVGTIGTIQMVDKAWVTDNSLVIDIISADADYRYVYYTLQIIDFTAITTGNAQPLVTATSIKNIEISLPSLEEQRRIASLLSRFDELIQLHEFKADNLIKAKQQIMSDIFSGGLRELESINPDAYVQDNWVTVKLGDIFTFVNGKAFKPSDWCEDGLPIIRIQNLTGNPEYNRFSGYIEDKYKIYNEDMILSWSGTIDIFRWTGENAVLNQHLFKVHCKSNIDNCMGYYILQSCIPGLRNLSHGAVMKHIKKGDVDGYEVKIPPTIEEQQKIANLLSSYDSLIELKRSQKQQVTNMKQQLMSQLLTNGGGAEQLGNC